MRRHSIIQNNMKKKTAAIFILIQEMKITAVFFLTSLDKGTQPFVVCDG